PLRGGLAAPRRGAEEDREAVAPRVRGRRPEGGAPRPRRRADGVGRRPRRGGRRRLAGPAAARAPLGPPRGPRAPRLPDRTARPREPRGRERSRLLPPARRHRRLGG